MSKKRIKAKISTILRNIYLSHKRKKFDNPSVTIICNNCIGGIIYSDLKNRFNSPTINLYIREEDFCFFCNHLDEYLDLPLQQIDIGFNYPCGIFDVAKKPHLRPVVLRFMHYDSYEVAVSKWNERTKRINYENIRVIFDLTSRKGEEGLFYNDFLTVQYKKIMLSERSFDNPFVKTINFKNQVFKYGRILQKDYLWLKFYDQFDYVSFLNKC